VTTAHLFVVAGGLYAAGSGLLTIALYHGARAGDQQPGPAQPDTRQQAEHSGLIPRPGGST
jgi:hypothetical protein